MEESREEIDEVDSMRIEDFNRLEAFYSMNKTFPVTEDEVILDVFRFFKKRDMILEATNIVDRSQVVEENQAGKNEETRRSERMDIDISFNERLSSAEILCLQCNLKNPKDVCNEFTAVDTNSLDTTKLDILLCQKSKHFLFWKKKKSCEPNSFGLSKK